MTFGSPSFGRLHLPARAGIIWASQVLGVSLHTCHALARPRQTLGNLTLNGCYVLASGTLKPSPSASLLLTRLYQASETAVSLTAYVIPCVRFNRFVRLCLHLLTAATLGTSGWLDLARLGLSPSQKHQALLGALVGQFEVARASCA